MRLRFRTLGLIIALCISGYALAQPAAKKGAPAPVPPPPAAEPAEESPLLIEPKTPAEMFDAAILTDRLYRPALAKQYLEKLLASNPSDEVLLDLRTKYGPAIFLHLASDRRLQPASTKLLDRVNTLFQKQGSDPAFVDSLIRGLFGPPVERDTSTLTLKNAGAIVVPRILQHIGAPAPNEDAGVLVQSIVTIGDRAIPVLYGALESTNDSLRNGAIQALGLLGSKQSVPFLLSPAFDRKQPTGIQEAARRALGRILGVPTEKGDGVSSFGAEAQLQKTAREYFAQRIKWPTAGDGLTDLWTWNEEAHTVVLNRVPPASASLYTGLQFAHQAVSLSPDDHEAQVLFLAVYFAWDAQSIKDRIGVRMGPGTPYDVALTAGPAVVSDTLGLALSMSNPAAAIGALRAMAAVGGRADLYGTRAARSHLLAALNDPNPEVQYTAAVTILELNPDRRFRGSERVVEILARAISGTRSPFAVVIDPNRERANETAGLFGQLGFETVTAFTGKDGFEIAADRSNVALVAVHANVIRWPLSQTLSNLRADARTASIPILIYGPEHVRSELQVALTHYPQVEFVVESASPQHIELQVGPFIKRAIASVESPANRAERIADATAWLATIANSNRTDIFNLSNAESALIGVSADPTVYANALAALSAIPTGAVQRYFEQLAVSERLNAPIREAAARHLAAHIQRFGLLLSAREAAEVEAAWHAAGNSRLATALAAAVGSLKPNAVRVGSRLQQVPPPAKPLP